jgi:hypothetical protein
MWPRSDKRQAVQINQSRRIRQASCQQSRACGRDDSLTASRGARNLQKQYLVVTGQIEFNNLKRDVVR